MSGGGGDTTSTANTIAKPWKEVQPYLKSMYGDAESLYQDGMPEYYPGKTYVSRDPLENQAMASQLAYAQDSMPSMVGQMQSANTQMLNAPDVANNPYISGVADTIQSRLNDNLFENTLPQIGHGAVGAGQYGGSRQGIAEGLAIGKTQQAYGDAMAQLYGDAYESGLDTQAKGMALAPQSMNMGFAPSEVMSNVGAYNRNEKELALQEDLARYQYNTGAPYENLGWYNNILMGAPWGGKSTSTAVGGPAGGGLGGALGGALMGASAAPMLGGLGASAGLGLSGGTMGPSAMLAAGAANPLMIPLILGGAALGGGLFS